MILYYMNILSFLLLLVFLYPFAPLKAKEIPTPTAIQVQRAQELKDYLWVIGGNKMTSYTEDLTQKPYLLIYYSASWCPPCKAFTPKLMQFYSQFKAKRSLFEVILVSLDKSEQQMLGYMKSFGMPWPAIYYDKRFSIDFLKQYTPNSIPRVIVLDSNGFPVLDNDGPNMPDGKITRPELVLEKFGDLLKNTSL